MARDKFHQEVRIAVEKEGWNITDDPLYIKLGKILVQIDLGGEKIIGAEKEGLDSSNIIMDKVLKYENIILGVLKPYANIRYSNIDAQNELIADKENHRYQIVTIGWDKDKFVHDCPIHIDIINGKIWVQRNMTEINLDKIFADHHIPKSDIVIGFLSPKMREYTEYAVA